MTDAPTLSRREGVASAEPRSGALGRLGVGVLVFASICMLFLISPQRLREWGIDYESTGGSAFSKVHPGTWAAFAALSLAALRHGNPLVYFGRALRWRGLTLFFAIWSALVVFVIVFEKTPFTPLIDSFLLPMVLFLLIAERDIPSPRAVALLIHALMAANASLALVEYLTGWRLTPFWAGDLLQVGDWRSTAFIGHPLSNAAITGSYALVLALGGGRDLPAPMRPLLMALQLAAMVAFGGRVALVLTLAVLGVIAVTRMIAILRGARVNLSYVALACLCAPFVIGALLYAIQTGFFDRLLERFVEDNGSAEARVIMLRVLDTFPLRQILFGPDPTWLASLQYQEGINYGIESFWLSFILEHGLFLSLIFFAGLAGFCVDMARATAPASSVLLFFYFAVASSSVSLSAKTTGFGLFTAVVMILLRSKQRVAAAPRGRAPIARAPERRAAC